MLANELNCKQPLQLGQQKTLEYTTFHLVHSFCQLPNDLCTLFRCKFYVPHDQIELACHLLEYTDHLYEKKKTKIKNETKRIMESSVSIIRTTVHIFIYATYRFPESFHLNFIPC